MQAYSSTLLQFIFKFQLVYFPYFYDDKVQKKCTNLVHSCNQMVHSYFAGYSRNRKISAKNARYLPFLSDICLYLPKSHNWGGRGRTFKSCHSDQIQPNGRQSVRLYFICAIALNLRPRPRPAPQVQRGGAGFPKASIARFGGSRQCAASSSLVTQTKHKKPCKPCAYRVFAICVQEPSCAPKRYFFGLYPNGCRCSRW